MTSPLASKSAVEGLGYSAPTPTLPHIRRLDGVWHAHAGVLELQPPHTLGTKTWSVSDGDMLLRFLALTLC